MLFTISLICICGFNDLKIFLRHQKKFWPLDIRQQSTEEAWNGIGHHNTAQDEKSGWKWIWNWWESQTSEMTFNCLHPFITFCFLSKETPRITHHHLRKVSVSESNVLLNEEVLTDPKIQALLLTVLVTSFSEWLKNILSLPHSQTSLHVEFKYLLLYLIIFCSSKVLRLASCPHLPFPSIKHPSKPPSSEFWLYCLMIFQATQVKNTSDEFEQRILYEFLAEASVVFPKVFPVV